MKPDDQDRAARNIEELQRLFPAGDSSPRRRQQRREPAPPRAKDPAVKAFDRVAAQDRPRASARAPVVVPVEPPVAPAGGPATRRPLRRVATLLLVPVLLVVAAFATGLGFGRAVHADGPPAATVPPASTQAPPSTATPGPPPTAPSACLDTARYGDQVISMLTEKVRDQRVNEPMLAYTKASQACRAAASP